MTLLVPFRFDMHLYVWLKLKNLHKTHEVFVVFKILEFYEKLSLKLEII
jgi:hypothetical protein